MALDPRIEPARVYSGTRSHPKVNIDFRIAHRPKNDQRIPQRRADFGLAIALDVVGVDPSGRIEIERAVFREIVLRLAKVIRGNERNGRITVHTELHLIEPWARIRDLSAIGKEAT